MSETTSSSLEEISNAITIFEKRPCDDHAQDIHLESLVPFSTAFFLSEKQPSEKHIALLKRGEIILSGTPSPTAITRHYANAMGRRANLLSAIRDGDRNTIQALLKEGLES